MWGEFFKYVFTFFFFFLLEISGVVQFCEFEVLGFCIIEFVGFVALCFFLFRF